MNQAGGDFEGKAWRRMVLADEFEAAGALVSAALASSPSAEGQLRSFYAGCGKGIGWVLVYNVADASLAAGSALLWEIYKDSDNPNDHRAAAGWGWLDGVTLTLSHT